MLLRPDHFKISFAPPRAASPQLLMFDEQQIVPDQPDPAYDDTRNDDGDQGDPLEDEEE
jgi:hypothetical protein